MPNQQAAFKELIDAGSDGARLCGEFLGLGRRMLRLWHQVCDGKLSYEQLARRVTPLRRALECNLRQVSRHSSGKARAQPRAFAAEAGAVALCAAVGRGPTNKCSEMACGTRCFDAQPEHARLAVRGENLNVRAKL